MRAWPARDDDFLVGPGSEQATLPLAQMAEAQLLLTAQFVLEAFADQAFQLMPDPFEIGVATIGNFCHMSSQIPGAGPDQGRRTPVQSRVRPPARRWPGSSRNKKACSDRVSTIVKKTCTYNTQLCYTHI